MEKHTYEYKARHMLHLLCCLIFVLKLWIRSNPPTQFCLQFTSAPIDDTAQRISSLHEWPHSAEITCGNTQPASLASSAKLCSILNIDPYQSLLCEEARISSSVCFDISLTLNFWVSLSFWLYLNLNSATWQRLLIIWLKSHFPYIPTCRYY